MLNLRMMCVNPIEIETSQYEGFISKKNKIGSFVGNFDNNEFTIEWLHKFNKLHTDGSSFCCIYAQDEHRISSDLLRLDLQNKTFFVNGVCQTRCRLIS